MKLNKQKVFALALAVCLIATLSMGSLAWFTDDDSVTNDFFIAGSEDENPDDVFSVDVWEDATPNDPDGEDKIQDGIEYPNILPGDDLYKEVNVENTGAYAQYIRTTVTVTDAHIWQAIYGEVYVPLNKIATDLNPAFSTYRIVFDADNDTLTYVLYYENILAVDEVVTLFTNVAIPEDLTREQAAEMAGGFQINVVAEAVQTENVGNNAVEAFATVRMAVEEGEFTINVTTPDGLLNALTAGASFTLTKNIDLAGCEWTPVGTEEDPYTGTIDGAGYTISNLTVGTADSEGAAMFAYVGEDAVIKNVKLENVAVNGKYVATVAYYAENATFENIEVLSGSINASSYGAGVVFEGYGLTITDCANHVSIDAGYSASGIGAWVYDCTIEGCANYGDMTGANRAGGICGNFSGTMTDCTNNGNVTSTGNGAAGGIIGILGGESTISDCVNNGNVTTTSSNVNASAAGILGQLPSKKAHINSCTNNGDITAEQSHAAGIAVSLYGGIEANGCTNTGVIAGAKGQAEIATAKGIYGGKNTIN